jgi:hypothetical protein
MKYCICGSSGYVATSPDAVAWTAVITGTTNQMYSVVRGPDRFVVVGSYRCIHILDNGAVDIYTTTYQYPFSIYYDGTYYWVAANHTTQILRSPDAITWTLVTLPGASAAVVSVGGEGLKIIVGRNSGYYSFSEDAGASWATLRYDVNAKWTVDVNNGQYIMSAFNSVVTSPTALTGTWTVGLNSAFAPMIIPSLRFGKNGGILIHSGSGSLGLHGYKRSLDNGVTFDLNPTTSFSCTLNRGCVFDGERFLLTGSTGDILYLDSTGLNGDLLANVGFDIYSIAFVDNGIQGIYPEKDGVWRHANEVHVAQEGVWRKANRVFIAGAGAWREVL